MKKISYQIIFWLTIVLVASWLRLVQLGSLPASPYWEEVALGYDAFSILKTGKDHHGNAWPIVAFESFGDWKPSGYFYAAAALIKIFGLSVWATRLPAAIAGIISVILLGWLVKLISQLWEIKLANWNLVIMALAAISPWGILFSRAAWEVNLATMFFLLSLGALLKFLRGWQINQNSRFFWLLISILTAVASMYTYHALRVITPIMIAWTLWSWLFQVGFKNIWQQFQKNFILTILIKIISLILATVLLWPLITNLTSPIIAQRFAETSLLNDLGPILQSNQLIEKYQGAFWAKLIYHRFWFQGQLIGQQFLKHLDPGFLFIKGDINPRHSVQYFGQLYYLDAVFSLLGAFFIWKKRPKLAIWLAGWWLIGTLPAAVSTAAPHALRTLPTWPVWLIIISYGLTRFVENRRWLLIFISAGYLLSLIWFWQIYTKIYNLSYGQDWQAGYENLYTNLRLMMSNQPNLPVYIARSQGRPAMYYWFYNQIDPKLVQAENLTARKDQAEFLDFKNLHFFTAASEIPSGLAIIATFKTQPNSLKPAWNIELKL